jgi:RNA recognition motif-containing protein
LKKLLKPIYSVKSSRSGEGVWRGCDLASFAKTAARFEGYSQHQSKALCVRPAIKGPEVSYHLVLSEEEEATRYEIIRAYRETGFLSTQTPQNASASKIFNSTSTTSNTKGAMESRDWRAKREPSHRGGRQSRRGAPYGRFNIPPTQPDPEAEHAIEQGRRLYVGNLPYKAKVTDIQSLFVEISDLIQDITMSVDPMTGRNPSYCFVDFITKDAALETMEKYDGRIFMKRPLKAKPGVKPRASSHRNTDAHRQDSNFEPAPEAPNESPYAFNRWRRLDAQVDIESMNQSAIEAGRRLYVGNLPRFSTQAEQNIGIRDLFKDYDVEVISKMVLPHQGFRNPIKSRYCFVDLKSRQDANAAIAGLNRIEKWNCVLDVSRSNGISGKLHGRSRVYVGGLPLFEDTESLKSEMKALFESFGKVKVVSAILAEKLAEKIPGSRKNTSYCFVEFDNGVQSDAAIAALDQTSRWNGTITVRQANPFQKAGHLEVGQELEDGEVLE